MEIYSDSFGFPLPLHFRPSKLSKTFVPYSNWKVVGGRQEKMPIAIN